MRDLESLEPLRELTWLEKLDVSFNRVRDLSPLSGLTSLQWLEVRGDESGDVLVTDLRPLLGLTRLKTLVVGDPGIRNLVPLSTLTSLEELDIRDAPISALQGVHGACGPPGRSTEIVHGANFVSLTQAAAQPRRARGARGEQPLWYESGGSALCWDRGSTTPDPRGQRAHCCDEPRQRSPTSA
jgi:hypothetical protein